MKTMIIGLVVLLAAACGAQDGRGATLEECHAIGGTAVLAYDGDTGEAFVQTCTVAP